MNAATQMTMTLKLEQNWIYNHRAEMLVKYSKFNDGYDFNNQWEMVMTQYKKRFTKVQHNLMNVIRRRAYKVPGVCNASFKTLQQDYQNEYGTSVSRDTWQRTVDKAEKMGLILKLGGKRLIEGRNSTTANVIIFNRHDEVRAYEIAQLEQQEKEIARLLEEEYARMSPAMNYAFNAMKWAEDKAAKQRQEQADKQRQEQAQKAAEQKAKKQSLYKKMATYIASKKMNVNVNEFMGIAYGSINKLKKSTNITQEQAEQIAFELFVKAVNTKKVKKTHAALYSWLMNDNFNLLTGKKETMTKREVTKKRGKKVGVITKGYVESIEDPIRKAELMAAYEQQQKEMEEIKNSNPILKAADDHWTQIHTEQQKAKEEQFKRELEQSGMNEKEYYEFKRAELLKSLNS